MPGMRAVGWSAALALVFAAETAATGLAAADFGSRHGPEPANIDAIASVLRQDPYDMELMISFGTSKGGSAGHLALALRDKAHGDDLVYSANFYADRASEHEQGFYTADLMVAIPKREYLFKTTSSLGEMASFGLDFGEIYKRSVIGVRVYGVPAGETEAVAAFFRRINDDYRKRVARTEYHDGEIKYGYLHLNCAKTIGSAFKFGAGYRNLEITSSPFAPRWKLASAVNANTPTGMAIKLLDEWNRRGYRMDVVYYRKYGGSRYVDPHEEEKVAFKDLPNRFPSVLSRDFRREHGQYKDFDNLFAMYLFHNLAKYRVGIGDETKLLAIEEVEDPMGYPEAAAVATESARLDSRKFLGRAPFRPRGKVLGEGPDEGIRYERSGQSKGRRRLGTRTPGPRRQWESDAAFNVPRFGARWRPGPLRAQGPWLQPAEVLGGKVVTHPHAVQEREPDHALGQWHQEHACRSQQQGEAGGGISFSTRAIPCGLREGRILRDDANRAGI